MIARGGNGSHTKRTGGNTGNLTGTAFTTCRQVLALQPALLFVVSTVSGPLQLICTTCKRLLACSGMTSITYIKKPTSHSAHLVIPCAASQVHRDPPWFLCMGLEPRATTGAQAVCCGA